jgi:hypothetical protein
VQSSFFLVQFGKLAPIKAGVFSILALGALVWGLAFVGILSLGRVVGASGPESSLLLLEASAGELEMASIPGLPEFPGATCCEFRDEVFGDERVIEIEYVVDSGVPEVRAYYGNALERGGWTVSDITWLRGEWIYSVSSGDRRGFVEIEDRDGSTEIEVEMAEPAVPGNTLTDR